MNINSSNFFNTLIKDINEAKDGGQTEEIVNAALKRLPILSREKPEKIKGFCNTIEKMQLNGDIKARVQLAYANTILGHTSINSVKKLKEDEIPLGKFIDILVETPVANKLINENMGGYEVAKILNAVSQIQEADRESVCTGAEKVFNKNMSSSDFTMILDTVRRTSEAERESVCTGAKRFVKENMSSYGVNRILRAVRQIPETDRESVCTSTKWVINENMGGYEVAKILNAVRQIPEADRESVCTSTKWVINENINGDDVIAILNAVRQIPEADRESVCTSTKRVINENMRSNKIVSILTVVNAIKASERADVLEKIAHLFNPPMNRSDIEGIILTVKSLNLSERGELIVLLSNNYSSTIFRALSIIQPTSLDEVKRLIAYFESSDSISDLLSKFYKQTVLFNLRDPTAILRYIGAHIKVGFSLSNKAVSSSRKFLKHLIQGDLDEFRYKGDHNPIIKKIEKTPGGQAFLKSWKKSVKYSPHELFETSFDDLLKTKLDPVNNDDMKEFKKLFDVTDDTDLRSQEEILKLVKKRCLEMRKGVKKNEGNKAELEKLEREYSQAALKVDLMRLTTLDSFSKQKKILERISKKLKGTEHEKEFLAILANKRVFPSFSCEDTTDPESLILHGTDVESCQKVDGSVSMNCGLAVRLISGESRLLVIKENGKIVGRALVRLMLDDNDNLVVFVGRLYNSKQRKDIENCLIKLVQKRAKEWNVPVLKLHSKGTCYESGSLRVLPNGLPGYFDSLGGDGGVSEDGSVVLKETERFPGTST